MKKIEFESIWSVQPTQDKVGNRSDNNINKKPTRPFYTDRMGDTKIGDAWQSDANFSEK
jgi:hypothetical protein